MKREEHYCDYCNKQMTYLDSSGVQEIEGITLASHVVADINSKHSCGTSSSRAQAHGIEFCSFKCFELSMKTFIDKIALQTGN